MIYRVNKQIRVTSDLKPYVDAAWLRRNDYVELPDHVGRRYHRASCFMVAKDQEGGAKLIVNPPKVEKPKKVSKKKPKKVSKKAGGKKREKAA